MFEAHRLLYHSTLGLRVIKKKKRVAKRWFDVCCVHAGPFLFFNTLQRRVE